MYITDAAVFEDDPSFSKRTAGWHECPERYDERTCWSTSDSFVLFLTLPALLIHFPFLLCHLSLFMFFRLGLAVVCYIFLASSYIFKSPFICVYVFLSTSDCQLNFLSILFCFDWPWWCVCCHVQKIFFLNLPSEGLDLLEVTWGGRLFWTDCRSESECLDSANVWFVVTGQF